MELLIRKELFGATCFCPATANRFYLNQSELISFIKDGILPFDIKLKKCKSVSYKLIKPKLIQENKFSFADTIYIELTRKCNLQCKHCLNNSGRELENQLTKDEVLNLICNLYNAGVQELRFTGGEPLLFCGIGECIKLAHNLGLKTSLGTNGTMLTEERIKQLKDAGLDQIVVSIDGTKEVHDKIRGVGNFDRALKGLMHAINRGIDVRVNSVLMKNNQEEIIELAKQLNKKGIKLFIRRFIQTGRAENLVDMELSPEEYLNVKNRLNEELKNNVQGHGLKNNNGTTSRIPLTFEIDTCRAGQRTLDITPDGNIYPCGFLAAKGYKSLGNIRNIDDWNCFWYNLQADSDLKNLRNNMKKYNETHIDKITCLAKFYKKES